MHVTSVSNPEQCAGDKFRRFMCVATREIMDCMFEACLAQDIRLDTDEIPIGKDPVWILGKKYDATQELETIRDDILSRLWFTYRKGFPPIGGGDGHTSDKGWGCMLRCGQMILGQALMRHHLGRDFRWEPNMRDATYLRIVHRFEDRRQAPFSIHQIALTGISERKQVGQWFGPNTVAQVLKKLVQYDEWSAVQIHVALDNIIVMNDIKNLCCVAEQGAEQPTLLNSWRPLLLIVPLRLGLTEINPIYVEGLQTCFMFSQSMGVIGGKPNQALYFIGCVGDRVVYLDPHTTQRCGSVEQKTTTEQIELDATYHCKRAAHMNILQMDPSIAVCFFCSSETDFNDLCQKIRDRRLSLFEICSEKPKQWTPTVDTTAEEALAAQLKAFRNLDSHDSENEFEIV